MGDRFPIDELAERSGEPTSRLADWHDRGLIGNDAEDYGDRDIERVWLIRTLLEGQGAASPGPQREPDEFGCEAGPDRLAWSDQARHLLARSVATVRPGSRWTDASAWRAQPSSQIVVVGSDSRFLTHSEFRRTVDTTTVSPRRAAANGTSCARPERRPVVATVTVPIPTTGGAPIPLLVKGPTRLLKARKAV